jgi:hypothetical protein
MPNEFKIKNGFFSEGSSNITGSLTVTGNVGIGTSNPTRTLQVVGEAAIPTLGVGSGGFFLASSNGLYGLFGGVSGATGDTWLQAMRNNTATAYNILLNPVGGNVGIGTTTPGAKLHVFGSNSGASAVYNGTLIVEQASGASIQILSANSQTLALRFGDPENGQVGRLEYSHVDNSMRMVTNAGEKIRITSTGNVGIGTTSPGSKLDVVGNIGVSGNIRDTTAKSFLWDTSGYLYAGNFSDPQNNLAYQVDSGIASITNQDSFDTSWIDNPSYNGQILANAIAGETLTAGQLVYLRTNGRWYLATATTIITSTQLIGIALKNAEATEKFAILLDGLIGISYHDQFGTISIGSPLYVSTTAGNVSEAAPSNSGEIVRLVGHNIYENSSNYAVIRFQPDNTWIEL